MLALAVGEALGKSLGEVLEFTTEELVLWAAYFEMKRERARGN